MMRTATKIWLITAALLILAGCVIFYNVMQALEWDFTRLSTFEYQTSVYDVSEKFSEISIKTEVADIIFYLSDDGKCRVEFYDEKSTEDTASVRNGILEIKQKNNRRWYERIGISFESPKITVYLPKAEYDTLLVKGNVGDTEITSGLIFGNLNISATTGDIILNNVITLKKLTLETSTGDVKLNGCDAGEISIETQTGDVIGSLLSNKIFMAKTSTGDVYLPSTASGGKCNITTSTGDIKISIKQKSE